MSNSMSKLTDINWVRKMADLEDQCLSVSAGCESVINLEASYLLTANCKKAFSKFIDFARRKKQLNINQLAEMSGADLIELVSIQLDPTYNPQPEIVQKLASFFEIPVNSLYKLSGLKPCEGSQIGDAAIKFLARIQSKEELNIDENIALNELLETIRSVDMGISD